MINPGCPIPPHSSAFHPVQRQMEKGEEATILRPAATRVVAARILLHPEGPSQKTSPPPFSSSPPFLKKGEMVGASLRTGVVTAIRKLSPPNQDRIAEWIATFQTIHSSPPYAKTSSPLTNSSPITYEKPASYQDERQASYQGAVESYKKLQQTGLELNGIPNLPSRSLSVLNSVLYLNPPVSPNNDLANGPQKDYYERLRNLYDQLQNACRETIDAFEKMQKLGVQSGDSSSPLS